MRSHWICMHVNVQGIIAINNTRYYDTMPVS